MQTVATDADNLQTRLFCFLSRLSSTKGTFQKCPIANFHLHFVTEGSEANAFFFVVAAVCHAFSFSDPLCVS